MKPVDIRDNKKCRKCKEVKPVSEFYRDKRSRDNCHSWCKGCVGIANVAWKEENRERVNEIARIWRLNNPDRIKAAKDKWKKQNPEKHKEMHRKYRIKKFLAGECRLRSNISTGINQALRTGKSGRGWEILVGYTTKQLIEHLQSKFRPNMGWNNYGKKGWHVDHIIPVSWWKFETPEDREFKQCWSLANLQPLWAFENYSKRDRTGGQHEL